MIKRFLVNGSEEKLSKSVLADEISNGLLPEATSEDEGKVISVDATGGYVLSTIESELPAATSEDEGKVVTVSQDGSYELAEAGGGAYILHRVYEDGGFQRLNKTWNEIKTALATNIVLIVSDELNASSSSMVHSAFRQDEDVGGVTYIRYKVSSATPNGSSETWTANDKNSYPVLK